MSKLRRDFNAHPLLTRPDLICGCAEPWCYPFYSQYIISFSSFPCIPISSSLCSLQRCVSSLHCWFLHTGIVLNPTLAEAIFYGTDPRLQSLRNLTSIKVARTSVHLADHVKLLGVTFDSHLNFDKHISNVCSAFYFHIRALRHIRPYLNSENSQTISCTIVGSILDHAKSILNGISSRNIHHLSSSARSEFLDTSRKSLNNQHYHSSQFTSLVPNSAANRL